MCKQVCTLVLRAYIQPCIYANVCRRPCVYIRACSLTDPEVDVSTGASRCYVLVVEYDQSQFVSLMAEIVDGHASLND